MKTVLSASALLSLCVARAFALPGAIDLDRLSGGLGAEGFAVPAGDRVVNPPPTPSAAVARVAPPPDDAVVSLSGLLDRHWTTVDSFSDPAGETYVSGTLDLNGDGWLVVAPPGAAPLMIKIERGMSGAWAAGGRRYAADLNVNIFRARLNNVLEIKDGSGATVWNRRIVDLFQRTYDAGRAVVIGGRPYRLFLSHLPGGGKPAAASSAVGLCLIYDQLDSSGRHDQYDFYRFDFSALVGKSLPVRLYGGDLATLSASSDGESLTISR